MKNCPYEQDYSSFSLCNCMAHDGKFMGSLVFRVPDEYLRQDMFNSFYEIRNDDFSVINMDSKSFILIMEGMRMDKWAPMIELAVKCFRSVLASQILREDINRNIAEALETYKKQNNVARFISFLDTHGFVFSEFNIGFDFCGCRLLMEMKEKPAKNSPDGFLANDNYYYYREKFGGSNFGPEKRVSKDIITLGSDYSQALEKPECMLRVNWHLLDNGTKCLLKTSDLRFTLDEFIQQKLRLLKDVFDNWLPHDGIIFNNSSVINISSSSNHSE